MRAKTPKAQRWREVGAGDGRREPFGETWAQGLCTDQLQGTTILVRSVRTPHRGGDEGVGMAPRLALGQQSWRTVMHD